MAEKPDYQLECFRNLQIDGASTTLIKAGLNQEEQGFLLPLSEHPWHLQCTHSYCVMVKLPENRRLIIPCMELIRFYFGSSSNLVTKLFSPPLTRDALYSDATFDRRSGRLQLKLADKMSGASASDIGRMHLDPAAWHAAVHIGTSALKASLASQAINPQALFPFEGKTTLTAAGKWLSFAGQPNASFLVYSLRSCSHPFPFKSLRYEVGRGRGHATLDKDIATAAKGLQRHASARDAPDQSLVERDASNRLGAKTHPIRSEPRFPDLEHKPVYKNIPLIEEPAPAQLIGGGPALQEASVGDPGSERRIRPKDLALHERRPEDEWNIPAYLRPVVAELRQLQAANIHLLTHSEADGWTVPVSIISNADGEIDPGLFLTAEDGGIRLRRTSAFSLELGNERTLIVVTESEPAQKFVYSGAEGNNDDLTKLLYRSAEDFLKATKTTIT